MECFECSGLVEDKKDPVHLKIDLFKSWSVKQTRNQMFDLKIKSCASLTAVIIFWNAQWTITLHSLHRIFKVHQHSESRWRLDVSRWVDVFHANYCQPWESASNQNNCKEVFGAGLHPFLGLISPRDYQQPVANQSHGSPSFVATFYPE